MKQKRRNRRETNKERMVRQSTNFLRQGMSMPKYLFVDTESVCPKCNKTLMFPSAADMLLTGRSTVVECKSCDTKVSITVE